MTTAPKPCSPVSPVASCPAPRRPRRPAVKRAPRPPVQLPPLLPYLRLVPDPRSARGLRHPLTAVLLLVACGFLRGCQSVRAVVDFGRDCDDTGSDLMGRLGFTRRTPCAATLGDLLAELDWERLETQLRAWLAACGSQLGWEDRTGPTPAEAALAIDGKTLRGARRMGAATFQMVAAAGHKLGLTHAQGIVKDGDEVAAVQALLRTLCLDGLVVTVDALHTCEATAALIVERGGDYLMTVKGNQPGLLEAIKAEFAKARLDGREPEIHRTQDFDHGRIENRALAVLPVPAGADWLKGAAQAFWVLREVYHRKKRKHTTVRVYGITSLKPEEADAERLLALNRGHWCVEVGNHGVRDVLFREDANRGCRGGLAQTLAIMRCGAMNAWLLGGTKERAREARKLQNQPQLLLGYLGMADN